MHTMCYEVIISFIYNKTQGNNDYQNHKSETNHRSLIGKDKYIIIAHMKEPEYAEAIFGFFHVDRVSRLKDINHTALPFSIQIQAIPFSNKFFDIEL